MLSANVVNRIVAMASNMIISRLLSADGYGLLSYIFNIYGYINLAEGFGLLLGTLQYGTENSLKNRQYPFFKYGIKKGNAVNTGILCVVILASFFVELPIKGANFLIRIYTPIIFIEYTMTILMNMLRCQDDIVGYSRSLNLNTVLNAIGTCVGAIWGIIGVIIGKYLAYTFTLLILCIYGRDNLRKVISSDDINTTEKKELWRYSLITGVTSALNCMLYLVDVSMVGNIIRQADEVGIYKIATLIPNALVFVPNSIVISVLPQIIIHQNDKQWLRNKLKKLYLGMGITNLSIAVVVVLMSKIIIRILAGSGYEGASRILQILIVGFSIEGTFKILTSNVLAALKRVKYNFIISIITIIFDVIFNIIFIKRFQIYGAAYATLLTELIVSIVSFIYAYYVVFRMEKN